MRTKRNGNDVLTKIEIVGEGFDELGHRYIKLKVKGSKRDLPPYSVAAIAKPDGLFQDLGDAGCNFFTRKSQQQLLTMLQNYHARRPRFAVATRLGAFGDYYVRPSEIIGTPDRLPVEPAFGSLDAEVLRKYRCRGSLERWQKKIGKLCEGNSRLMFAASLACTGPLLQFISGPRTGGFQISGPAEQGKTTGAMVAGSFWGCYRDTVRKEKGFIESWNTTLNALEDTAQAHSDALLVLDETNLAGDNNKGRAERVLDAIFRLSENTKKKRYNEVAGAAWRLYFLSTSNYTLNELASQGGAPIDDQHRGRMVDVVLPTGPDAFGIYEDLHGFKSGAALTDAIKQRCRTIYGTPGLAFIRKIYENKDSRLFAKAFVAKRRNRYIEILKQKAHAINIKPLERATSRFATVYAAGCLAIKYGILLWKRNDLLRAVLSCQLDSFAAATPRADQIASLRERLIDYLARERPRFISLNGKKLSTDHHELGSAPGYTHTHNGKDWLYLTSDQLKAIVGQGAAAKRLKYALVKENLMASTDKRALVQRPVFKGKRNKGYRWVHAFRTALLENRMSTPQRLAL